MMRWQGPASPHRAPARLRDGIDALDCREARIRRQSTLSCFVQRAHRLPRAARLPPPKRTANCPGAADLLAPATAARKLQLRGQRGPKRTLFRHSASPISASAASPPASHTSTSTRSATPVFLPTESDPVAAAKLAGREQQCAVIAPQERRGSGNGASLTSVTLPFADLSRAAPACRRRRSSPSRWVLGRRGAYRRHWGRTDSRFRAAPGTAVSRSCRFMQHATFADRVTRWRNRIVALVFIGVGKPVKREDRRPPSEKMAESPLTVPKGGSEHRYPV